MFAVAADTGVEWALAGAAISGVSAGIIKGVQTGDYQEALDAGAMAASEGFMWGAIGGCVFGAASSYVQAPAWMKIPGGHPTWMETEQEYYCLLVEEFEEDVLVRTQVSYMNGEEVTSTTLNATRPDIVVTDPNGSITAIELKNWDLENYLPGVTRELERQVGSRVSNLPGNATQEIVFDVRGRGYSSEFLEYVEVYVTEALSEVCPAGYDVPIVFWGA